MKRTTVTLQQALAEVRELGMTEADEKRISKLYKTAEQTASLALSVRLPSIPIICNGDIMLNEDTMEEIVDFVNGDGESYCALTAVSKSFHAALTPRQKKVWIGGFERREDFMARGLVGMEFFSARNSEWIRNKDLAEVANPNSFPQLHAVDLVGCSTRMIDDDEILEFVKGMGSRLTTFRISLASVVFTHNLLAHLAAHCSTSLTCLELDHIIWHDSYEELLEKMTSLRELTLGLSRGAPDKLPKRLEVLRFRSRYSLRWSPLAGLNLPNLKTLQITDSSGGSGCLSAHLLISIMSKSKRLETFVLKAVGINSKLYLGDPADEEERLFWFLSRNRINYIGPAHVTLRAGASFADDTDWLP
jgi:hypothetical protein